LLSFTMKSTSWSVPGGFPFSTMYVASSTPLPLATAPAA
jgi:hypothetical protein